MICIWNLPEEDRKCDFCCYGGGCDARPSRRSGVVYPKMRDMDKGEEVSFPISRWNACRTAKTILKKMYGCDFTVHKDGEVVIVKRTL